MAASSSSSTPSASGGWQFRSRFGDTTHTKVTFRDAESARRSVSEPNPVIDGRRANCNIASQGRPRPSPPRGRSPAGPPYQGPPQTMGPPYSRVPAQMPPPHPPAVYNPQMTPQYYQMYGATSPSTVGPPPYHYTGVGYTMPNPRTSFQSPQHRPHPPYIQYPTAQMEGPFPPPSLPSNFQLQHPPHVRQQPLNITDSHASQPPSAAGSNAESTDA
ncbi:putative RNA-binding protein ARP1 [Ananas comosus]|uniref:Putative RNA-binding protein ARP1 n=1 Tax=Ananas comosus TaxID=4615 RepID=A0A199VMK6_ANACO|nr:putative RNA-binding protein ARP1 [Ananas comosus]